MAEPIVTMRDIVKEFPGVRAVDHGRFDLHPGEVHADATVSRMLLGEAMLAALQRRRQVGAAGGAGQLVTMWAS